MIDKGLNALLLYYDITKHIYKVCNKMMTDAFQHVLPLVISALWVTLKISAFGIAIALILGLAVSLVIFLRVPVLHALGNGYVAFFRNTPLLLHLFFLYFGLPRAFGILLSFETTALLGLSLLGGAYMAEAFKSGLSAIAPIQLDAAKALGINRLQLVRYVLVPQALSYSVPAIGANAIFLFKETSVFTAIAGTDITTVLINQISSVGHTDLNLTLLVLSYMVVIIPMAMLLHYIEKRVRHAEFGA